jgi:hypothetical protein
MQPSNAQVKAAYKEIVIAGSKKRGYDLDKFPGSYSIYMTKKTDDYVVSIDCIQYSSGDIGIYPPGIFLIPVEAHLLEATKLSPPYNVSIGKWHWPTFNLFGYWKDRPEPPSRAFATIEEAEAFFHTYMEWMETKGFDLIDYYASIENMNEEMQNTHDIPETPGVLWIGFGMAGVVRYYRGLIIAKLCNKHFEERLEKIYRELNYFIHEYPDPKFNESSKGTLAEFETVLPYIRQIKPIYNL